MCRYLKKKDLAVMMGCYMQFYFFENCMIFTFNETLDDGSMVARNHIKY